MIEAELEKYNDELLEKLKKACEELYPHFDAIEIFAIKHENNEVGTSRFNYGIGNFFARYGLIKLWIKNQELEDNAE